METFEKDPEFSNHTCISKKNHIHHQVLVTWPPDIMLPKARRLRHLVPSAPLLRGTKVGGDDAPVVFLLEPSAQLLGINCHKGCLNVSDLSMI